MTARGRGRVGIAAAVSLLSACGAPKAVQPVDPLTGAELATPLAVFAPQFERAPTCSPLTVYRPPPVGTRIDYRRDSGSRSSRTITAAAGDTVTFVYRESGAKEPLPPRPVGAGFMLTAGAITPNRRLTYAADPLSVLRTLQPGQVVIIPTEERSSVKKSALALSLPTVVRYEACGDVAVDGHRHFVRVYRVSRGRRVLDRAHHADRILRSESTYYLADDLGFPLIFQDRAITVAERISLPSAT